MPKIKFSHNYKKLNGETAAILGAANWIHLENQTPEFIKYDAEGIYPLPDEGKYIILSFFGDGGTFFTTLRPHTESKWIYYKTRIGDHFDIEVTS